MGPRASGRVFSRGRRRPGLVGRRRSPLWCEPPGGRTTTPEPTSPDAPARTVPRSVPQGLRRTHRGAHRFQAFRGAVVTHIAFHHLVERRDVLGDAKWAGVDAIGAANAARLQRGLDHTILVLLDGVGRTDLGAGRVLAMHADHGDGLSACHPVDGVELDERDPAMSVALGAGLDTRSTPDAAAVIDREHRRGRVDEGQGVVVGHHGRSPCRVRSRSS